MNKGPRSVRRAGGAAAAYGSSSVAAVLKWIVKLRWRQRLGPVQTAGGLGLLEARTRKDRSDSGASFPNEARPSAVMPGWA
jgi:hypothetical protein